jgi:hypothetical protein
MHRLFRAFDSNNDRILSKVEFVRLLESIGAYVSPLLPSLLSVEDYDFWIASRPCTCSMSILEQPLPSYPFSGTPLEHSNVRLTFCVPHPQYNFSGIEDDGSKSRSTRVATVTAGFLTLCDPLGTGDVSAKNFAKVFLDRTVKSIIVDPENQTAFGSEELVGKKRQRYESPIKVRVGLACSCTHLAARPCILTARR